MIESVGCSGSGIGMKRHIALQGGGKVTERLEVSRAYDLFGYSILENDALPIIDYFAFVTLESLSDAKTRVVYQSNFTATGENPQEMSVMITQLYNSIIDGIIALG